MPQLGEYQYLLDTVFFLYPSAADAKAGSASGGTGFFVTIPSETVVGHHHCYAVTNWHVALGTSERMPCPNIRVNSRSGAPVVFEHDPSEWEFIGGRYDVAVLPVDYLNPSQLRVEALNAMSFCLAEAEVAQRELNAGEDLFMLGRFIDYDGVEANCPSMRFGNIAMMDARQRQATGYVGQSIVADMHSRTGYSGSPVFVYRTAGSIFAKEGTIIGGGHLLKLLGVNWGSFPEDWEVAASPAGKPLTGVSVRGMSGMSLVCPSWHLMEVLNMPKLKAKRKDLDEKLATQAKGAPVLQSVAPKPTTGPDPDDVLRRMLNTPPQPHKKPSE